MKKILLIVMMLVMCVSSACFASDGSVLDAEGKMVDQFLNASSYKNVSSILSNGLKEKFDEKAFIEFKAGIDKELGKATDKQLVVVNKFPQNDRLIYGVQFEKGPVMRLIVEFELNGEKPLLAGFVLDQPQPAGEQGKEEQK